MPFLPVTIQKLNERIGTGITHFTKGEFKDALVTFRACIQSTTMMAVLTSQEVQQVKQLTKQAVEYVTACRLELKRRELQQSGGDITRQLELACYMTLCGIETAHKFLTYKSAFLVNTKAGNFITAARFANQIIELESTGVSTFFLSSQIRIFLVAQSEITTGIKC